MYMLTNRNSLTRNRNDAPASNGTGTSPNPANAWARPLKTAGPPPGMGPADKTRAPSAQNNSSAKKKSQPSKGSNETASPLTGLHRERMLHLSLVLVGQKVVATLTDGTVLEGVFHTFTPFEKIAEDVKNKYVLNAVRVVKSGDNSPWKDGSTVILGVEKVSHITAKSINLERPKSGAPFGADKGADVMTDTQISGSRGGQNRGLVAAGSAWTANPGSKTTRADALAGALDDTKGSRRGKPEAGLQGSIGGWDQFKANHELFNVKATFDENLYTTQLDKSQMDSRKIAAAERLAKEIENTTSSNIHVAEERGHAVETDYDEEDRYSGVLTKEGKQRHDADASMKKEKKGKMNYAAVAAGNNSDTGKAAPPGFTGASNGQKSAAPEKDEKKSEAPAKEEPKKEENVVKDNKEKPVDKSKTNKEEVEASKDAAATKEGDQTGEEKTESKKVTKSSKLNANAKAFTFNPSAKSFTPSFGSTTTNYPASQQQPQHVGDPGVQMHPTGHPMQPPHYVHQTAMAQPGKFSSAVGGVKFLFLFLFYSRTPFIGMVPMMSPQYAGMRYPPQYAGMEQHGVAQMPPQQAQHVQVPTAGSATNQPPAARQNSQTPATTSETEGASNSQEEAQVPGNSGDQAPTSQQPQQPSQQAMQVQYNMPPQGAYFANAAMGMHMRGPGYPPQFVGGPQQVAVNAPYRQMYPMQPGAMPPNMHMRGPGGAPYYPGPGNPMPYPAGAYHGSVDDDGGFRGRGRGSGRGRGRRGGRGGRGGRGHYQQQSYGHGSGRSTPQHQSSNEDTNNNSGDKQPDNSKVET